MLFGTGRRSLKVEIDVPEGLSLAGNPFLLQQALSNLVQNAIDWSLEGGTIEVAAAATADRIALTVADRGPGIPDFALGRIFDRFYSLGRPDTGKKSTGLGLNFVREVAASHDGTIRVTNRPGGGAVAELGLPRR